MKRGAVIFGFLISVLWVPFGGAEDNGDKNRDALKEKIEGLLEIAEVSSPESREVLFKSLEKLILPDSKKWFSATFGSETGAKLEKEYSELEGQIEGLAGLFANCKRKNQTNVVITSISNSENPKGTGLQRAALRAMKKPVTLYSVRMIEPGEKYGMHLWSFVKVGDSFYIIGKMRSFSDDVR